MQISLAPALCWLLIGIGGYYVLLFHWLQPRPSHCAGVTVFSGSVFVLFGPQLQVSCAPTHNTAVHGLFFMPLHLPIPPAALVGAHA